MWLIFLVLTSFVKNAESAAWLVPKEFLRREKRTAVFSLTDSSGASAYLSLDTAIAKRYACKRFKRFDGTDDETTASQSDPSVVKRARCCLDLARLAPSAFNTQPYKMVIVHSANQKLALSRYCLGPNAARVRDSDCTVIFCADRKIMRTFPSFFRWLRSTNQPEHTSTRLARLRMQFYISMFSSGYPIPRFMSAPVSFLVRTAFSVVGWFTRRFYPMPTLASAETWSSKQAALVAMSYMLACSARGLATLPMEGIDAVGIRRLVKIPSRYSIPLIVSTGTASREKHFSLDQQQKRRYPMTDVIFDDEFGRPVN